MPPAEDLDRGMERIRPVHRRTRSGSLPAGGRLLESVTPKYNKYGATSPSVSADDSWIMNGFANGGPNGANGAANGARKPNGVAQRPAAVQVVPEACVTHIVDYDIDRVLEHKPLESVADFPAEQTRGGVGRARWVTVDGATAGDVEAVRKALGVPHLPAHSESAPRLEVFDAAQVLLVCQAPIPAAAGEDAADGGEPVYSQVAFFVDVQQNLMLVLHRRGEGGADDLRSKMLALVRGNTDDLRRHSVVHLLCVALLVLVDRFSPLLESAGEALDEVEATLLSDADLGVGKDIVKRIAAAKRSMLDLRRQVWPFRKTLSRLSLVPFPNCDSRLYFRDVLDHVIQILDVLEIHRDGAHSLLDIYLGAQNNRMQEIMQKIAVVTTIFVPLTFLTGVEGMNFTYMPELSGKYSYLSFLLLVGGVVVGMITWFRRRGWL